jgi:histidine triad (HIT) family protein
MKTDCIFCKIIAGDVPATKIYEDADVLAFLDIAPVVKGHTLVIPKPHHADIASTPPEVLAKLIGVVRKVARAQLTGLGAQGISVSQANGAIAGQVVPHIHFHVIPRFEGNGRPIQWKQTQYDSADEMQEVAVKIKAAANGD